MCDLIFKNDVLHKDTKIKIIDMGSCSRYDEGVEGLVGTITYVAPEILKNEIYDEKCDVWSLGVIFFMLLTSKKYFFIFWNKIYLGNVPFDDLNANLSEKDIFDKVISGDYTFPSNVSISDEARELLGKMLC